MNQGHSAAWDQQWQRAAEYYADALEQIPDHPAALTSLGLALFEQAQYEPALDCYKRAARVAPNDPIPVERMARIYERQGKLSEAVQTGLQAAELQLKAQDVQKATDAWQAVLNLQPENLLARTRLGMVYDRTGRKTEAVAEYLAAASIIQRSGDAAKAAQLANYAQQLMPENMDTRRAVNMLKSGQMLPRPGKPKTGPLALPAAVESAKPAEAAEEGMDPISEARQDALTQLAGILFDQIDDSPAQPQGSGRGISALARGLGSINDDSSKRTRVLLHLSQAIDSLTHGQGAQAAAELERAQEAGLNHPSSLFLLGMLTNNTDRLKALRCLQESVKHPSFTLASYLLMGQNYEAQGQPRAAAAMFLEALRLADVQSMPEAQREELDQLYEPLIENQTQQVDEPGLKTINQTIAGQLLRPDWRAFLLVARQQLPGQSAGGAPTPLAEMLLESRSSQVVELLSKVRRLTAQNKYRTAMEEAFYALQFAPTYLPLHVQIGELLLAEGHIQAAVSKFLTVAHLYNLRGEAGQAIRLLTRVMQMAPLDITVRTALIDLLIAQGRIDEAMQQYNDLGDFYYQMSDLERARGSYLTALKLPQAAQAGRALCVKILQKAADIDLQRLDLRGARGVYEQIRVLQPEDPATRAQLVSLSIRLGQDEAALAEVDGYIGLMESQNSRARAIAFLQGLVNERPERLDLRKRLADVFIRAGQTDKAVEQLDAIADGLLVAKNKTGALAIMENIIALNPSNVEDYRSALAQLKKS
jgi:tetratricopeptide (TPR) repeat protein